MAKVNIRTSKPENHSREYYCIHSIQKLNSEFDTYVLTSNIPIFQLLKNRDILLVDDLKGDARWGMNKIIQRNISSKRVQEIKSEYLEANNRSIKFFPAITVALLPKSNGEPIQHFIHSSAGFDEINGITVEKSYESDEYIPDFPVLLKWDKDEISALVIDGQHRVSAIRSFYEGKNESSYNGISIPVTFVIFKNDPKIDLIQATRALFIDVNNTPRLVSEEKLIFIDDRSIHRRITAKSLGSNDPGDDKEDVYQQMLHKDDYLLSDNSFINRYLIEESGKDDEENRGFFSNHGNLFPWEISNIMTIHRNIIGNILLRYKELDKTRDIRSVCNQLNPIILSEIENAESLEEISGTKFKGLIERLTHGGLKDSEIDIFNNLIRLKTKNLEEIQQAQSEFFIGSLATEDEEKDRAELIALLNNIYNQDCSKDSAFELSASKITEILKENCKLYIELITRVFNEIWFTKQIKDSILAYTGENRELIFNFILNTHESSKVENNLRKGKDRVQKQIKLFLDDITENVIQRKQILQEWTFQLEQLQNGNILKTVVGQEMLFLYLADLNSKYSLIDIDSEIQFINSLGLKSFFENNYKLELNFLNKEEFKIAEFNQWSEIIMTGSSMKPGIINANKGSNLIFAIKNKIINRTVAVGNLRLLDRLQKAYGQYVLNILINGDLNKLFTIYSSAKEFENLENYLTENDIETISEDFPDFEHITPKAKNVIIKLLGGVALEQVVNHFKTEL
ncbi:MAG: hypothetical protein RL308_256 [Bacteroidota bacterium]|jgi:hypothetical protein